MKRPVYIYIYIHTHIHIHTHTYAQRHEYYGTDWSKKIGFGEKQEGRRSTPEGKVDDAKLSADLTSTTDVCI